MSEQTLAIVPALDEVATVATVVAEIRRDLDVDVLVIDDGSRDGTAVAARSAGAMVVSHPFNLGVGAAMRTGFRVARSRGYDRAIQIDADGQHPADGARRLLEAVAGSGVSPTRPAVAVGSRFAAGGSYRASGLRRLAMRVLARIVSRRTGTALTDVTSGFRAFDRRAIELFALEYPSAYLSDTVEALLLAHGAGLPIVELPTPMQARQGGEASNNRLRSTYHLLRIVLVIAMFRFRRVDGPSAPEPPA